MAHSRIGDVTKRIQRRSRDGRVQGPRGNGMPERALHPMTGAAEVGAGVIVESQA